MSINISFCRVIIGMITYFKYHSLFDDMIKFYMPSFCFSHLFLLGFILPRFSLILFIHSSGVFWMNVYVTFEQSQFYLIYFYPARIYTIYLYLINTIRYGFQYNADKQS